jgi:nucleotide-binding universal stress UspA family protein
VETIVVGLEESAGSKAAVAWAASYARERGSAVVVVDALPGMLELAALQINTDPMAASEATRARAVACAPLRDAGIEYRLVVHEGETASALLEAAKQEDADLIVYGHTVHGGLAEHVLGAAMHKLLTHARCPVVVVPAAH